MPEKAAKAKAEGDKNNETLSINPHAKVNNDHSSAYRSWWQLFRSRNELLSKIEIISRYIVCSRVTKRPIFEFVDSSIHPNDALQVFPLEDDYSFGIIQSSIHWEWFKARCSTLKGDWRYTSDTVFDSFPWPQNPSLENIEEVCNYSKELRIKRREIMNRDKLSLRDLYRLIETTPNNPVSNIQVKLDTAVKKSFGMDKKHDVLTFLLELNIKLAKKELDGTNITGPGLPDFIENKLKFISDDRFSIY